MLTDPKLEAWISRYKSTYKREPTNYAITAYNAVMVIADTVDRVVKSGKPVTRSAVREAMEKTNLSSLQGPIEFDENGDIKLKVISVYQVRDGKFTYIESAPQN